MTEVLIVGKTHMAGGVCIGGMVLDDARSVRLIPRGRQNHPNDTSLYVGDIWNVEFFNAHEVTPPHTEDVIVTDQDFVRQQPGLPQIIRDRARVVQGDPSQLYDGSIRFLQSGKGYICHDGGVPQYSTCYWAPGVHLVAESYYGNTVYRYDDRGITRRFKYVGFDDPVECIPLGSIVRVSLARWWRPEEEPGTEERCYAQLSGWF